MGQGRLSGDSAGLSASAGARVRATCLQPAPSNSGREKRGSQTALTPGPSPLAPLPRGEGKEL